MVTVGKETRELDPTVLPRKSTVVDRPSVSSRLRWLRPRAHRHKEGDAAAAAAAAAIDENTVCFVATAHGHVVGEARYVLWGGEHELAVTVADHHQGQGLGGLLIDRLRTEAHERGVTSLRAVVQADNAAMLRLLEKRGIYRPADRRHRGGRRRCHRRVHTGLGAPDRSDPSARGSPGALGEPRGQRAAPGWVRHPPVPRSARPGPSRLPSRRARPLSPCRAGRHGGPPTSRERRSLCRDLPSTRPRPARSGHRAVGRRVAESSGGTRPNLFLGILTGAAPAPLADWVEQLSPWRAVAGQTATWADSSAP